MAPNGWLANRAESATQIWEPVPAEICGTVPRYLTQQEGTSVGHDV